MDPVSLAASLITIVATCKVAYRFGKKVKNAPKTVKKQSRQLLKHSEKIKQIARDLENSTTSVSKKTLGLVRANLQSAERLLADFHKRTAFLRISSVKATIKLDRIKGARYGIKKLCGMLTCCLLGTTKFVGEMKKLAKCTSELELNEKIKQLEEKSRRYDESSRLSEESTIQFDEKSILYEAENRQVEKKSKERPKKTTQDRTSDQQTKCCESNQTGWTVGGAVVGAVVGGIIGFRVGGGWGAVAGVVVGGIVGGVMGRWFSG